MGGFIVDERQIIRDYAREPNTLDVGGIAVQFGTRGEAAGKVFVALQNVLTAIEDTERVNGVAVSSTTLREAIGKAFE